MGREASTGRGSTNATTSYSAASGSLRSLELIRDVGEHRASPAGRVGRMCFPGERYQLVDRRWVVVAGRRRQARQARHQSLEQCPRYGGASWTLGVDEVLGDHVGRPVGRFRGSVRWGRSPVRRWTARECLGTSTRRVPLGRSWDSGGSARVLSAAPSRRRSRSAFGPVDQALVQPAATLPSLRTPATPSDHSRGSPHAGTAGRAAAMVLSSRRRRWRCR
jgi:hypothetical protein